jgi:hypothetical protein
VQYRRWLLRGSAKTVRRRVLRSAADHDVNYDDPSGHDHVDHYLNHNVSTCHDHNVNHDDSTGLDHDHFDDHLSSTPCHDHVDSTAVHRVPPGRNLP